MLSTTDDRGAALLFASIALLVVAALGTAVLARAESRTTSSARAVDRARAETLVDVAVADAWGRIEGGALAPFRGSDSTPTGDWAYEAFPVGDDRWDLEVSTGDDHHGVTAVVSFGRDARHPYTLFADEITTGALSGRVRGRVGATGAVVFGGRALGDTQELVGPDATCRGCDNPVDVDRPRNRYAVRPPGSSTRACPATAGEISGPLTPGDPYLCDTPGVLTAVDPIDLTPPVMLVLGRDVSLDLATSTWNRGGRAADLVVVQDDAGGGEIRATDADITAMIVAPSTPMTVHGLTWRGTIDVASFTAPPGAAVTGDWDPGLVDLGHDGWRVTGWDLQRR